jgi:3-oxoadipate enol-lactonase
MLIKANGIQMNLEVSGKKRTSVVILSHSLGCSLTMWDPQMDALEPHFQVLRYDIRGHGRSEAPPGPYTPELLAKDAIALLDALEIDKVHWVGLSMGGMIGQAVALNHSDRLKSLALCDTTGVMPLVIIQSARHLPNVEQSELFKTNLLTFLKSLSPIGTFPKL